MTQVLDNCRFDHHEWPIADRRSIRRVELVVTADTSGPFSGSVVFDSSQRPRRVVPLALALTLAIIGVVHSTSSLLTSHRPRWGRPVGIADGRPGDRAAIGSLSRAVTAYQARISPNVNWK